ncbi:hypothetical protein SteCoe_32161 [Stentor coeruleus]|uniref:Ubiquitin thioesterase OTU n=1 Tax=Stentor coeruleus TaxID=5963 RepID=A0A1R2AZJ9_9CILI|nr:hypothetical protein SteCoe_32161 [Stentor coeruleus]
MITIYVVHEYKMLCLKGSPSLPISVLQKNITKITGIEAEFQYLVKKGSIIIPNENCKVGQFLSDGDKINLKVLNMPFKEFLEKYPGKTPWELGGSLEREFMISCSTQRFDDGSAMMVKIMSYDNSCLFSAVNYAMFKNINDSGCLREYIGNYLQNNPERFDSYALGKSLQEYIYWIRNPMSWGGEIELIILSEYFNIEICVISVNPISENLINDEKDYKKRIYLLYTNSHYNLIIRNFPDGDPDMDVTRFSKNSKTHSLALDAAGNYRAKHFHSENEKLLCLSCNAKFVGKSAALAHAHETNHFDITFDNK